MDCFRIGPDGLIPDNKKKKRNRFSAKQASNSI